ncbi:MAG: DUF1232 domain-containing protein [Lachnospiraceae bacterium]|nr:DUF1232 domain-containing protein [Lachnospiraceae bacterium]
MKNGMKGMLLVLAILYVISPIDACPGPIDDLLVVIMTMASQRRTA